MAWLAHQSQGDHMHTQPEKGQLLLHSGLPSGSQTATSLIGPGLENRSRASPVAQWQRILLVPDLRRSHIPWSNSACAPKLLSLFSRVQGQND